MFGRANWAILGLAKESLENFRIHLEDRALMMASSQMAASAVTRFFNTDALGINPFRAPRLDEDNPLDLEHHEALARYASADVEARSGQQAPSEAFDSEGYAFGAERFGIHGTLPWYGLWAVSNEWKDVSDLASIKEQRSYELLERPYKFLQGPDRKSVDQDTLGVTAAMRKQVPVLLDFNEGRVYVESNNKKLIYAAIVRLQQLGAEIIPVAWAYPVSNWPAAILNKLYEGTDYDGDFVKRADEATRFSAKEIEKLEDRELEAIVANYFSMTRLPSDIWVGISGPAQIRLHDTSPPIGVKAPTSATTLLHMTDGAKVLSGALTFQERIATTSKNGEERTFRRDLLTVDLNDRINFTDVGAAMLRGFDVPSFRKGIQREIKETKQVPSIEQFWGGLLHELNNAVRTIEGSFREILDLDGNEAGGILPMRIAEPEEEAAEVAAV